MQPILFLVPTAHLGTWTLWMAAAAAKHRSRPGGADSTASHPNHLFNRVTSSTHGGCLGTIGKCTVAPAFQKFAHTSKPCGCQAPGAAFDVAKTVCDPSPVNGRIGCETAQDGASSNYQLVKGNCLPAVVKSCPTGERVASGPRNKGCICLPITTPDGPAGQACPAMSSSDGLGNHGRMTCKLLANGDPMCQPECAAGRTDKPNARLLPRSNPSGRTWNGGGDGDDRLSIVHSRHYFLANTRQFRVQLAREISSK
ncbi:hypothetical protein B0H14DRAFT_2590335 [Mycena olivaceomarginata]|nr:hypothetical protein B0H14DRAFT_2590335 [Mycena olivaceomarginata]